MRRYSLHRYLIIAVLAVLVYSVLLYTGTAYLQVRLAEGLAESTGAVETEVNLRPELPLGLVTGGFSTVRVVLNEAVLGEITAKTVILNGRQVDVAMGRLISGESFSFDQVGVVEARLDLTAENINSYFDRFAFASEILNVQIAPDTFELTGTFPIVGRQLEVSLRGGLIVLPENKLRIIPQRLVVQNAEMPPVLMEQLLQDYLVIPIDLSSLPVPLKLSEVQLGEGKVSVYANTD